MMYVRDLMSRPAISVGPATPLKEVATLLVDHRISGVPVVDDAGRVLGVVTEADFLLKSRGGEAVRHRPLARLIGDSAEATAQQAKVAAVTAGEAMTSPPVTIGPENRIVEAASRMIEHRVNRLPVVEGGRLAGIITRADLVRAFVRSDAELVRAIEQDVLLRILWLDPATFDVEVRNGVARIRGHVERRSTADILDRTIAVLPGIVELDNEVTWSKDDTVPEPAGNLDIAYPFMQR
ncbi:MAG TPA: CBS domain-containing protein [Candidatus Limnocylindrales bacterium]|jgi:CBS domain-containing protein